jgi:hypothetical protein
LASARFDHGVAATAGARAEQLATPRTIAPRCHAPVPRWRTAGWLALDGREPLEQVPLRHVRLTPGKVEELGLVPLRADGAVFRA